MFNRLLLLSFMIFALTACNRSNVSVQPNGDGTATVNITLSESEINTMIAQLMQQAENPLLRNPSVDLQTGRVVVSGDYERPDGGGTVAGSVTLQLTLSGGQVNVQVTQADIEGFDVSDARLAQFNDDLARRLGARARQDNARAELTGLTISDTAVDITLRVQGRDQ